MRQTISGLVAAIAVVAASAAPAMACGGGLFQGISPCAQAYVPAPVYSGCNSGCGGWAYERLPDPVQQYHYADPVHQYYYADQGPTYSGPGDFAPYPVYREDAMPVWGAYRHHPYYYHHRTFYRYHEGAGVRYGYAPRHGYGPRYSLRPRQFYARHHNLRYGTPAGEPRHYGEREHTHRYY
jgi:hypothetical protein